MQTEYSAAVVYLKEKHPSVSPFLATVLLLLYEGGQVGYSKLATPKLRIHHKQACLQRRDQGLNLELSFRPSHRSMTVCFVGQKGSCLSCKVCSSSTPAPVTCP